MPTPVEVSPQEVKRLLDEGSVALIDCREPHEFQLARIEGAELIPMRAIPAELESLKSREGALVIHCHHGVRSLRVASWLREQGIERAQSMTGGIDAWSLTIDPGVPRYS